MPVRLRAAYRGPRCAFDLVQRGDMPADSSEELSAQAMLGRLSEIRESAGGPPGSGAARQTWLPHGHLMPGDTAIMRELADSTLSHFDFLDPGRR